MDKAIRISYRGRNSYISRLDAFELAADRYALRRFCTAHFRMPLHEDIVPIAEALDRSLEAYYSEVCLHVAGRSS